MNKPFSLGHLFGFLFGLWLVSIFWKLIFVPGGSGSNIILGLVLAGASVYYVTKHFGAYIDDRFFHGGSRERAVLVRRLRKLVLESNLELKPILANSKKRVKVGEDRLFKHQRCLEQASQTVLTVRSQWSNRDLIPDHVQAIKSMLSQLQNSIDEFHRSSTSKLGFLKGWDSFLGALIAAIALRVFIIEPYQIPSGSMIPTLLVGDHLFVSKLSYGVMNPFASKPSYVVRWGTPKPGEVVIFEAPYYVGHHAGETWIKRVIAGPGQKIYIRENVIYVDGQPYTHVLPEMRVLYWDYFSMGEPGILFGDRGGVWGEQEAIYTQEQINSVTHDVYFSPLDQRRFFESNWPLPMQKPLNGLACDEHACTVAPGHIFAMGDNRGNSSDGRVWGAVPIENVKGKAVFVWMSVDGSTRSIDWDRFALPGFRFERWFKMIH